MSSGQRAAVRHLEVLARQIRRVSMVNKKEVSVYGRGAILDDEFVCLSSCIRYGVVTALLRALCTLALALCPCLCRRRETPPGMRNRPETPDSRP
jgi:hypothetical protein